MQPIQRNMAIVGMFAMLLGSTTPAHGPGECEHLFLAFVENVKKMQVTMLELQAFAEQEAKTLDKKLAGFELDLDARRIETIASTLKLTALQATLYDDWLLVMESQSEAVNCIYSD